MLMGVCLFLPEINFQIMAYHEVLYQFQSSNSFFFFLRIPGWPCMTSIYFIVLREQLLGRFASADLNAFVLFMKGDCLSCHDIKRNIIRKRWKRWINAP